MYVEMATALAAVRLQRPQQEVVDAVHKYMEVVHGMRDLGSSGASQVRALRGLGRHPSKVVTSHSRGRICWVPLFRTSTPRREVLISAMSEEHDITDMQETDKVSGEWWKPILTAVHDWSQDKLLGLAELADGSLFFSFGPGSDSTRPAKPSKAKSEARITSTTHNPKTLPQRHPSSFRKHSPIPASRKKASDLKITAKEAAPTAQPPAEDKPQKTQKTKISSSKFTAQPQRPPSSFSKRSPIPKDRVTVPASTSKKKSHETPVVEAPSKAEHGAAIDSPFSPELKEILNHGKETTAGQEGKETGKSTKTSSGAPARKKATKLLSEETVEVVQTESGGSAKKKTSKTESEETIVEVVENGAVSKDLGSYKLPELRSLAKARGLKGYSKLKKGELVDLLAGLEI